MRRWICLCWMMMESFDAPALVYMFVSLVQNMILSALKTPNIPFCWSQVVTFIKKKAEYIALGCRSWYIQLFLPLSKKHQCRGFLGVPTAGWRNAPAYSPRGSTRGSAKLLGRSSFGSITQEHTDLEWFGPSERNTLHPLCDVLLYE